MSAPTPGISVFIRGILGYLRPYRSQSLLVGSLLVLESLLVALIPLSLRAIIDSGLIERDQRTLAVALGVLAGAGIIITAGGLFRDYVLARLQAGMLSDIRSGMFKHLQQLSPAFYARTRTGEILSRFSSDLASVENAVTAAAQRGILPALNCIVATIILIALDWRLSVIALFIWPWFLLVPRSLVPKVSDASYERKTRDEKIMIALQENVAAQPVVKAFSLEQFSTSSFLDRNADLKRSSNRAELLSALLERSTVVGVLLLLVVTMSAGARFAYAGNITIGTLVAFQALFLTLSYSLLYVTQYLSNLGPATFGMKRINDLLGESSRLADVPGVVELPRPNKSIEFSHVTFGYNPSHPNIYDVNLTVPHGASVAVVGPSGSGKSTLLTLLMRFYDPQAGTVSIDGHDLRTVANDTLRRHMGIVFQDSFLFNMTVRENIRLGRLDATDDEVVEAARAAEIHDVICSLPAGYSTLAGEGGSQLSAGERQRIAIARALVRNPAILLLDEATSALDPPTEQALNATIHRLGQGRTVISATHRLASTAGADMIFVLDKGSVVEHGRHSMLLPAAGLYSRLWNKQTGFTLHDHGDRVEIDIARLRSLPILSSFDQSLLTELQSQFDTEHYPAGRVIVHEGDPGDRFYVIVRGAATVSKAHRDGDNPDVLGVLQDGDFFGEIALLKDTPRTATVRATMPCICLSLRRENFTAILNRFPDIREQVTQIARARYAQLGQGWETS